MALSKKVFFGSLFEFNTSGAEDLIADFRNTFPEPSSAPFISYDKFNKIFSCEVDHGELRQIPAFIANFQAYIERHSKRRNDLVESPRLRPIRGTRMDDEQEDEIAHKHNLAATSNRILDFDEDSDTHDEEGSSSSSTHVNYWTPANGDVKILTNDIAEKVANLTGCFLFTEPAENRVRLVNGDTELARTKLVNLEPYMTLSAKHRIAAGSRADSNVLISQTGGKDTALKFVRPNLPHSGFARIIVDPATQLVFDHITLCELRVRDGGEYIKPPNLDLLGDDLPAHDTVGPSKALNKITLPSLGSPVNIEPRTSPSKGTNSNVSDEPPTTKFLGTTGALRVTEWSRNVEPNATADIEPPEPLPESQQTRRRVLAEDSSDEDEEVLTSPLRPTSDPAKLQGGTSNLSTPPATEHFIQESSQIREAIFSTNRDDLDVSQEASFVVGGDNEPSRDLFEQNRPSEPAISASQGSKQRSRDVPPRFASRNTFDILTGDSDVQEPIDSSDIAGSSSPQPSTFDNNLIELSSEVNPASTQNNEIGLSGAFAIEGSKPKKSTPSKNVAFREDDIDRRSKVFRERQNQQNSDEGYENRAQSRIYAPQEHTESYNAQYGPPTTPLPRPVSRNMMPPPLPQHNRGEITPVYDRSSQYRGSGRSLSGKQALIDISEDPPSESLTAPPPGFDYRINTRFRPSENCLIDGPADEGFHRQPLLPSPNGSSDKTWSSSVISAAPRGHIDYTPQFTVPKRNMKYLQQEAALQLKAQMQAKTHDKISDDDVNQNALPPERLQNTDESQSRTFHHIMHQQSSNPAKGKGKGAGNKGGHKQESKKDKDARIAKAKADAYGGTIATSPAQLPSKSSHIPDKMSAKKRELIRKNPDMAALHPGHIEKVSLEAQTVSLRAKLEPLFDAARAFSGDLQFEYQIGQALIFRTGRLKEGSLYKAKDWTELLDSEDHTRLPVTFTNIVTTNGLEIDQLLLLKDPDGVPKVWQPDPIASSFVKFEFSCQDKTGSAFTIEVGKNGEYSLMKSRSIIGKVALHFPGQIWDACAILHGSSEWTDVPLELAQGVAQFMTFLYVPQDSSKISIYYRMPGNNTFDIRDIIVKRISIHNCLMADRTEFQLKITEVKALVHSAHPSDKKLFRSYEFGFNDMVEKGRLHYEVSVLHSGIQKAFVANKRLEVGELTDEINGRALITHSFVQSSLSLLNYVIEHVDWLGATNVGTLRRAQEETNRKQAFMNASLPPQALTQIGRSIPVRLGNFTTPSTHQSTLRAVAPGAAELHNTSVVGDINEPRIIAGVRAGTNADLYQQDGQFFYYGQGGARIPVVASDIVGLKNMSLNVTNEPIMPHESASQIGEIARLRQAAESLSAAGQTRRRLPGDDKPAGFW